MENQDTRLQQAMASLRYIGAEIHNRREKLKKSVASIAFVTRISREEIEMIERGEDTGNAADIMVLCEVLGMDYAELMMAALKYGSEQIGGETEKPKIIKGGFFKGKS